MKKQRLQLKDLEVISFTTSAQKILGGSCDCSLHTGRICEKACSDNCPTADCSANC
jgi:hypothetical protein